jgi:hypothetical protein
LCSGTSCILARSIPRKSWRGARLSRCSTRPPASRGRWRCSRKTVATPCPTMRRWSACACLSCSCIGHGSGERAGWPGSFGGNSGWTASGRSAWRRAARAHAGIRSCKFWCPTGSLPRAASGSCTGIGSARAPWPTCWVRTSGWRKRTNFTLAMTGFWHTRRHCSLIWWSAGGPCSTPISRSCCTT